MVAARQAGWLRLLSAWMSKRHNRWFASAEQGGLSACNFLVSLLVLNYSGIAVLGEYGFWFSLSQLSSLLAAGFAINQMVLHVADSSVRRQREALAVTASVILCLQLLPGLLLALGVFLRYNDSATGSLAFAVVVYTLTFSFSELARQFLYMRGRQRLSLFYAATAICVAMLIFVVVIFVLKPPDALASAFWCLAIAQGGYVLIAALVMRAWRFAKRPSRSMIAETVGFYWSHGRLAAAGMIVTWGQNKSVAPLLVIMMDNVTAGVFQIARMIFAPINMITTGLARSALSQVRRAWGDGDESALRVAVNDHLRSSMKVVVTFIVLASVSLYLIDAFGLKQVPPQFPYIFMATTAVVLLTNYRFWISCRFSVKLQYAFLLINGCIATSVALLWMLAGGLWVKSAPMVVLGSAIGEIYMLHVLHRRLASTNQARVLD